jgi:hypothetical protein
MCHIFDRFSIFFGHVLIGLSCPNHIFHLETMLVAIHYLLMLNYQVLSPLYDLIINLAVFFLCLPQLLSCLRSPLFILSVPIYLCYLIICPLEPLFDRGLLILQLF